MDVNFFAPVELTRGVLPLLRRGNAPLIVNIGSVLGHFSIPRRAEYCASKFALHGFSDSLYLELADDIDVLLVSPSTTSSEFFDRAISLPNEPPRHRRGAPPDRVARAIERAMRAGRREIILSWGGSLLVWFDRLAPALMSRVMKRLRR
jgi:short-subunit dehydrogenase